jgi:hypothetical protein
METLSGLYSVQNKIYTYVYINVHQEHRISNKIVPVPVGTGILSMRVPNLIPGPDTELKWAHWYPTDLSNKPKATGGAEVKNMLYMPMVHLSYNTWPLQ